MSYASLLALATLQLEADCQDNAANTTVVDSSGEGNDGATSSRNTSAMTITGPTAWLAKGLALNGSESITFTNSSNADFQPTTTMSISVWLKATSYNTYSLAFGTTNGSTEGYRLWSNGTNIKFGIQAWNGTVATSTALPTDGSWHHVVATYDGANVRIYVDGVAGTAPAETATITYGSTGIPTAGVGGGWDFWTGGISQLCFWNNYCLTQSDVNAMFAGPSTAPTLSTATINSAGTSLTLVFSEAVNGNTGVTINPSGGSAGLTYSSGSGSTTLVYTIGRTILSSETVTLDYTPGNIVSVSASIGLDAISARSVTNNSTQTDSTVPTVTAVTISATQLTITFSEATTGSTGFTLAASGAAITLSGAAGSGTSTRTFTLSRTPASTESFALSYTAGDVVDLASNALATITGRLVTNTVNNTAGTSSLIGSGLIQ
jgi:hypothetical protein